MNAVNTFLIIAVFATSAAFGSRPGANESVFLYTRSDFIGNQLTLKAEYAHQFCFHQQIKNNKIKDVLKVLFSARPSKRIQQAGKTKLAINRKETNKSTFRMKRLTQYHQ